MAMAHMAVAVRAPGLPPRLLSARPGSFSCAMSHSGFSAIPFVKIAFWPLGEIAPLFPLLGTQRLDLPMPMMRLRLGQFDLDINVAGHRHVPVMRLSMVAIQRSHLASSVAVSRGIVNRASP